MDRPEHPPTTAIPAAAVPDDADDATTDVATTDAATTDDATVGSTARGTGAARGDTRVAPSGGDGARSGGPLGPGTLGRRLLVRVVSLVAVLAIGLGTISTLVTYQLLLTQVDAQLDAATARQPNSPGRGGGDGPGNGLALPAAQPVGTLVILVQQGTAYGGVRREGASGQITLEQITQAAVTQAAGAASPGQHVTVSLDQLGLYRVSARRNATSTVIVGLPLTGVTSTVRDLVLVEITMTLVALGAAAAVTRTLVVRSLASLHRLAQTSREVAGTPLHTGQVELVRVPPAGPGAATEVVHLGTAVNDMLDHVEKSLAAREASESKLRQFVADASHELRNPLAAIRGYAELTRRERDALPPSTAFALSRVESEATRMSGLVEDMLLLARLDAGRDLQCGEVDLTEITVNALSDARAAGPDHVWRLRLPKAAPVTAWGDPARLHQVMVNLLANARTHTPAGTVVEVALDSTADRAVLTVTDNGPGVPEDLIQRVFERFTRADQSRARTYDVSTGLGLAIVAAVVEAHGGRVGIESNPGRTVFTVELPVRPPEQPDQT